jgi:hypothetical protein
VTTPNDQAPLKPRQKAFARELGIAIANGGRDQDVVRAYEAAGYRADRGNARRLAADPRVKAIADEACAEALRLAGLHIGYLQAKALEMLNLSPVRVLLAIRKCLNAEGVLRRDLSEEEVAQLEAATWALSKSRIGDVNVEIGDKKSIIEMLAKQTGAGKEEASVNVSMTLEQLVAQSMRPKGPVSPPGVPRSSHDPNGDAPHQLADLLDTERRGVGGRRF